MIDQTCTSHKQLTRIIAVHSLYVIVISTVFPDANIYNMMRLFWKINEYTKPMALMYNCWHTRNKEDKTFLLNTTLINAWIGKLYLQHKC